MRFTIKSGQTGRIIIALALASALSGTGCSRIVSWADRMGDHMPTYGDRRCEDRNFCWSSAQTTTATPEQMQQRRAANPGRQGAYAAPPPAPMPLPEAPAMMPQSSGMQGGPLAPVRLPASEEEARRMAEQGQMAPAPGAIPIEDAPPGMPQEMLQGNVEKPVEGLKPYEQNPPWKDDNPPVPVLEQIKEQGW